MNSIKAVFVAVNAYIYFYGKVFVEGAVSVANSSISQSQPKRNKKRHDGPIRQQSRSHSKQRKIDDSADVAASSSGQSSAEASTDEPSKGGARANSFSGNDTVFHRCFRRKEVSGKGTVVDRRETVVSGDDESMELEEDVSDQGIAEVNVLESAINLSNPFSYLPDDLRRPILNFLNPTDLARTWLVGKSFFLGGQSWGHDDNLEMVRSYFRKRFSMPELLSEFFQLADKHGRQQMARFFAEFFLNYKSGDVRFQYDAFAQRVNSDFMGQNMRIIRRIREAAIDFLRHGRPATIDPNHMQNAARIESMSHDDLTEFVTHLRTWFPPDDALVRTDTPFASVTAYQYLEFLFDSIHSANNIPLRMTIENVQQCAESRNLLLKLVQPKGVLLNDDGTFADISGKNGVFCGVKWVRTEPDDDEVQLQGNFYVPIGQAHGGFRDRTGTVVDSHTLTKLLRAIENPDSPLDVDFPHACRVLTVDLLPGGIRRRPDRGAKITEAFLRASDHRRAIMRVIGAFDRIIGGAIVTELHEHLQAEGEFE